MRTTILAALFATSLLLPAHARAQQLSSYELNDFVGQYVLADGRVLTVSQRGRYLVAQVEGQEAVALRPSGQARFDAPDGQLHIAFDQHANGNVTGVAVAMRPAAAQQARR